MSERSRRSARPPIERASEQAATVNGDCELCEAARFTEWFHEDEQCWIAECESCALPMVVWRIHDPQPPEDVKAELHAKLRAVVEQHFEGAIRIDDTLRTIDTHYHAHARPIAFGAGLHRR